MKDTEHDYGTHFCLERGGEGQQRGNQGAKAGLRMRPFLEEREEDLSWVRGWFRCEDRCVLSR